MSGDIQRDIILRLRPKRLAALLRSVERERKVDHAAQRIAALIGGDVSELNQWWHLTSGGADARGLSVQGHNQR
jgi:hypothetical protein